FGFGGLVNVNGGMPIIIGCDATHNMYDFIDTSSNSITFAGTRSESANVALISSGTNVNMSGIGHVGGQSTATCTSTGPILHVTPSPGTFFPGMYLTGSDGTNSLPASGGQPPVTRIITQLTGSVGGTGDYLMDQSATPGNLSSCTVTANSCFATLIGAGLGTVTECTAQHAVIVGSNNS